MDSMGYIKAACTETACAVPDYKKLSITELADRYCAAVDNNDESEQSAYMAALSLRFMDAVNRLYAKHHQALHLEREDFYSWVVGAILQACDPSNRVWQDPNKHTNAQAAINKTLATRFEAAAYYDANLQCNKTFYVSDSFDVEIDDNGTTFGELLPDTDVEFIDQLELTSVIQGFLDSGKVVEAIILDMIATQDVFKHDKKTVKTTNGAGEPYRYVEHSTVFWPRKLMQVLNSIPADYSKYFSYKYDIANTELTSALSALVKASNTKKYRFVAKTLSTARAAFAC